MSYTGDLSDLVDHLAHWLPTQGPIKEFVHHNTLHAFQNREFHDALRTASRMYGARSYLPLSYYRTLYAEGRITEAALNTAIDDALRADSSAKSSFKAKMLEGRLPDEMIPAGVAASGTRSRWQERHGLRLNTAVHPVLFRLVSGFLDQGIAVWSMPHSGEGLFAAVKKCTQQSVLPLAPFSDPVARELFELGPKQAIETVLTRFVSSPKHFERYLTELTLSHPGWSGMIRMIEKEPGSLVNRRSVTLLEFIALELIAEYAFVVRELGKSFAPIVGSDEAVQPLPVDLEKAETSETERLQAVWHEAFERTYCVEVLGALEKHVPAQVQKTPFVQAFFCIDDRECSFRRYLEETEPAIETYATAGFFGIDCVFQGVGDLFPFKHCPLPVTPKHLIREVPGPDTTEKGAGGINRRILQLEGRSNTFFRGWLISQTLGLWASLKLAVEVFRPTMGPATASSLRRVRDDASLRVLREGDAPADHGYFVGYTFEEMADRVGNLLKGTGAANSTFSELVVFVGHGASSVNNPYFAAYDCGACSGKPGAPNARAFAVMANRPEVRALLKARGVEIPETTWFVGALHDTTRDEMQYYDLQFLPDRLKERLQKFQSIAESALEKNSQERCRRFELVPLDISGKKAIAEARKRSTAIFEPRPEYNHATNAAVIVGRRSMTRGLFLDRRSFLNSYDYSVDPKGDILAGILGAVVPVCGGINLEYFFSRIDPSVYGAGSKLPHNVLGLIGVMNGTEGDLLTGLPTQMTEIHDPLRLMLVIEQDPELALKTAMRNPEVFEWIKNSWMRLFVVEPGTQRVFEYSDGKMVQVDSKSLPEARRVRSWKDALDGRENLAVAEVAV